MITNKQDEVYRNIKLKQIDGQDVLCPNCKHGFLKQFWYDYTCRWCGSRFRQLKSAKND